ncbi:hypothetical protein [Ovoidimarina sediminis]|nr:hypothetical protein [Rhodophyticola sp. MJ-SS7]MDU8942700.1 hypothetical protein [Rhodophyticola sp. MJ-SS7]
MASHITWIAATAIILGAVSGATAGYWNAETGAREAQDAVATAWRI